MRQKPEVFNLTNFPVETSASAFGHPCLQLSVLFEQSLLLAFNFFCDASGFFVSVRGRIKRNQLDA